MTASGKAVVRALLSCPHCGVQHIDKGRWALFNHKRHLCFGCGAFFEVPEANVGVVKLDRLE